MMFCPVLTVCLHIWFLAITFGEHLVLSDLRQGAEPLRSLSLVKRSSSSSWTTFYGSIDAPGPGASTGVLFIEIRKVQDLFTKEILREHL